MRSATPNRWTLRSVHRWWRFVYYRTWDGNSWVHVRLKTSPSVKMTLSSFRRMMRK